MHTSPIFFMLFTAGACVMWIFSLLGALRRRPYYAFVLVFMTAYCFCSEFLAIRLGKYYYGPFLLEICGNEPTGHLPWPLSLLQYGGCLAPNWNIPIGVIALESSMFMAILWTADLLTSSPSVKPLLAALMGVNLDAIIDPVAASSTWCSKELGGVSFVGLGFWTWFTTEQNPGYWFGVPILNYTTWFISMAAFAFAVHSMERRILGDEHGVLSQLWAALSAMVGLLVVEFLLVLTVQTVLDLHPDLAWQAGILLAMIGLSLLVVLPAMRGFNRANPRDWTTLAPQLFPLVFFPAALVIHGGFPHKGWLYLVAPVTFLIGAAFAFAPYSKPGARR
ncbi:MAG TPA: carotenoid biosynthesis protein [Gemmatimonadales bacterium]|nr:carotenoid biosynthesis protein [Gemmatimonadales bacterium]